MNSSKIETCPDNLERLREMKEHISLIVRLKGERTGVREARKHVAWYTKGMHGGAAVRNEVCQTESYQQLVEIIDKFSSLNDRH